jgi:hypothetical protein
MNEVCDDWSSAWLNLQRQLANDARAHAGQAPRIRQNSDSTSWLDRALARAALRAEVRCPTPKD